MERTRDGDDIQPLKRRQFSSPTTAEDMAVITKGFNTSKNTQWALKLFCEWRAQRNGDDTIDKCPDDLLRSPDSTFGLVGLSMK